MKQKLLITLAFLMTWGTEIAWADEYSDAQTNITEGFYRIYASTDGGTHRYYLKVNSNLSGNEVDMAVTTTSVGEASVFNIAQSTDGSNKLKETGWKIANNGYAFTNPSGGNKDNNNFTQGTCLRGEKLSYRTSEFDRQVLYYKDGAYAVRSTNSSGTVWGAGAYWGLDNSNNAYYVSSASYVWYFERVYCAAPNGNYAICYNSTYYVTQLNAGTDNSSNSIYYANLFNKELRTPKSKTGKTSDDQPNANWTFTFTPVDGSDASKGVKAMVGNSHYLCKDGYVKAGTSGDADILYFIATTDGGPYAITGDKTNYWVGTDDYGWDNTNKTNYIKKSETPDYNFTYQDIKLKYYDQTSDYTPVESSDKINAVIYRGNMSTSNWYTMVLPFAVSSVTDMFGSEATVATLDSYSGNTFNFSTVSSINANTPFLVKPGYNTVALTSNQQSGAHTCYAITISAEAEPGGEPQSSVSGATFTGVYSSGYVPVGCYFISGNELWYSDAGESNTLGAFRAYLSLTSVVGSVKAFSFSVDGETTGIMTIGEKGEVEVSTEVYDLNGRRVNKSTRGLYIVKGKKVVLK